MKRRTFLSLIVLAAILLVQSAGIAHATFPGVNGTIAFWRWDPSTDEQTLITANPDGSNQIVVSHRHSYCPDWRPDGARLLFTYSLANGASQLATIAPDGSGFQQLTSGATISECGSWSPDQQRIVFDFSPSIDGNDPAFSTSLYVMGADGSNPRRFLTPGTDGFDVEPRWQPTGDLIVFSRIRKYVTGVQQEAVFTAHADGTHLRQLTPYGTAPEHPSWSPDGRWIVFNDAAFVPGAHETIWKMRADGSDLHVLYQGTHNSGGTKPQFSPDGTRILFMCVRYGEAFGNTRAEDLCTMHADGTHVLDITPTDGLFENQPSWGSAPLR